MALPKKRNPIADQKRVEKAVEIAREQTEKPRKKKLGRNPLAGDRSSKITFYLSPETAERFDIAFLQEQLRLKKSGQKVDKSLIIETALKEWMERNGY